MNSSFLQSAERINKEKRKRKRWNKVVTALACIVAFCTAYALVLPAITMESQKTIVCTKEQLSGHIHDENCKDENDNFICGYADFVIHSHTEECYDPQEILICPLAEVEEHQHSWSCYTIEEAVELSEAHVHDDNCYVYEEICTCAQEEHEGHVHEKACYDESENLNCSIEECDAHTHNESCYQMVQGELTCTLQELTDSSEDEQMPVAEELVCNEIEVICHEHTEECFDENGVLVCGMIQVLRHEHHEECVKTVKPQAEEPKPEELKPEGFAEKLGEIRNMSFIGDDFSLVVTYPAEGCLPDDVVLEVCEITGDDYESYLELAVDALDANTEEVTFCRFFDVSFLLSGEKIEPAAPIQITISYPQKIEDSEACSAVHFAEDGIEVLDVISASAEEGESFTFEQSSLSVIGTVVTSPIPLEDGEQYMFYTRRDRKMVALSSKGTPSMDEEIVKLSDTTFGAAAGVDIENLFWTYHAATRSLKGNNGKYLSLRRNQAPSTTTEPQSITVQGMGNGQVRISRGSGSNTVYMMQNTQGFYGTNTAASAVALNVAKRAETSLSSGALTILDDIRESGTLKAVYEEDDGSLTYLWYKSTDNGRSWTKVERVLVAEINEQWLYNVNENGTALNVSLDNGSEATYKVVLADADGKPTETESEPFKVPYYDELKNGGFENPAARNNYGYFSDVLSGTITVTPNTSVHYQPFYMSGDPQLVWKTTASDHLVEIIWPDPSHSMTVWDPYYNKQRTLTFKEVAERYHHVDIPSEGVQFAEINAEADGALYQDMLTIPGSTMNWSLDHRARGNATNSGERDTMYLLIMSVKLAEQYNITTQSAVLRVINNPENYPGAYVKSITDNNRAWYTHQGTYLVPEEQYLSRFFFVAGNTASGGVTIGNHIDNIWFSTKLPPPTEGKANLQIDKTIVGLNEADAKALLERLRFTVNGETVQGNQFVNFMTVGEKAFTASYHQQLDIGYISSVTETIREIATTAEVAGYTRTTAVAANGETAAEGDSVTITIQNKGSGTVSFTNSYERPNASVELHKVDDNGRALTGAVFSLDRFDGTWSAVNDSIAVDTQGKATLSDLQYDVLYRLSEITSPTGYHRLNAPVYFKLVSMDGKAVLSPSNAAGEDLTSWPDQVTDLTNGVLGLQISNLYSMILPETGGIGKLPLQLTGLCLLAAFMLFIVTTRRKNAKGEFE